MVLVHQQQQPQQHQQQKTSSNDSSNRNGGSLKRAAAAGGGGGGGASGATGGVWPPQNGNLKVRKPSLGGRRIIGGPSTPVPRWKLYENPFYDGIAAAAAAAAQQQQHLEQQQQLSGCQGGGGGGAGGHGGGRTVAVSARKLAATLWELQEFPFSVAGAATATITTSASSGGKASSCPCIRHRTSSSSSCSSVTANANAANNAAAAAAKKATNHTTRTTHTTHFVTLAEERNVNSSNDSTNSAMPVSPPSCQTATAAPPPPHHSAFLQNQRQPANLDESMVSLQHSNKQAWETVKRISQSQSTSTRQVAAMRSHVHRLLERRADARLTRLTSAQANSGSYMVLNRIQDIQEQRHSAAMPPSVVAALRIELECARTRVHELELAHKSARREIDNLLKKVTEEKVMWRNQEQEKIRSAVQAVKTEADEEKKARRRVESVNRKMSRELIDANIAVAKAVQELERERKARELMEDVCDELAREIGEDKAEFEELKRDSARVRDEVEEERQMLQMAEVWREERVQMKLAEARLEIEEKMGMLDSLKGELEAFLKSKHVLLNYEKDDAGTREEAIQEAEILNTALDSLRMSDILQNPCRSPVAADKEALNLYSGDQSSAGSHQSDRRRSWGWGGIQPSNSNSHGEADPRLETREEVLERLRRKYDQNGQRALLINNDGQEASSAEKRVPVLQQDKPDERGDGSDYNSQSDHQEDDTKEDDGSQWESASDEDLEALQQQSYLNKCPQNGRAGAEHETGINNVANGLDSTSSSQVCATSKPPANLPSGDDLWRVSPPLGAHVFNEEHQRRVTAEEHRNALGRSMADLARNPHFKLLTEQGVASPSREWRSPDRGNPHIARGIKGFIEWPKMSRENGVKGKVLDSKIDKVDRRMLKQSS